MPEMIVIAGANGSGKTSAAEFLLPRTRIKEFVNADEIARGLSPFNPAGQRVAAGRLMIERIRDLIIARKSFAIETTLSGLGLVNFIKSAKKNGYRTKIHYLYISDVKINLKRIEQRVKQGGHFVPSKDVRRRYKQSLKNLFAVYERLFDAVLIYSNDEKKPVLIAQTLFGNSRRLVFNSNMWTSLVEITRKA
jgi:predicted ABC-type ATPase